MPATAADYAWWGRWRPAWTEAHCVTLVSDSTAADVVAALGAEPADHVHGFDALFERTVGDWPGGYDPARAILGVADLDHGWTLVAEVNGFVGVTERLIGPLSVDRTIVSHFGNVNSASRFQFWRAGRLLVDVDLMFAAERFGADPDVLGDDLRDVGVPLDADPTEIAEIDLSAAGFALAERITDVRCTPELFENSTFLVAAVDLPGGEEQQRYTEALAATWRIPETW